MMDYQESIGLLTSQGKFHISLGLERMQKIMALLGNPQDKLKFIHVAGTNGKGSTCAILSSVLSNNSYKTGLFTSPHIFEYTERVKINNQEIPKEVFAQKVEEITEIADENDIQLTEFEIITALAFDYFAKEEVEIVVLETGLGGRLDATNIISQNLCSVITHIDLDHTERLGNTIETVSREKAGIIKKNCPLIVSKTNKGIGVIEEIAKEKNSHIYFVKKPQKQLIEVLSLKGKWQEENLGIAIEVIEVLKEQGISISQEDLLRGLSKVVHPCRFEYFKDKNILIDGAHNPDGAKALRQSLEEFYPDQNYRFIFGCLRNKNYPKMMSNLFNQGDEIYFYHFDYPNSANYEELSEACAFESRVFSEKVVDEKKLNVICGSFYMIKELVDKMGIK